MWFRRSAAAVADAPVEPERTIVREDYRGARLAVLRRVVDPSRSEGLEFGAFDFPVVSPDTGRCSFADVRSSPQLAEIFGVPIETIAPVEWIVDRGRPLAEQIPRRFDYVILCHVLEHVPEPIRFLNDVGTLLRPGGVALLAVPDKRQTLDAPRPSTTIDHLLARHHHGAPGPPLAQIMEFSRAWDENWRKLAAEQPRAFFEWAAQLATLIADYGLPFRVVDAACDEQVEMLFLLEATERAPGRLDVPEELAPRAQR